LPLLKFQPSYISFPLLPATSVTRRLYYIILFLLNIYHAPFILQQLTGLAKKLVSFPATKVQFSSLVSKTAP